MVSEELVAVGFLDNAIPMETKRKIVVALKNWDEVLEPSKRFPSHNTNPQEMTTQGLDEFVMKSRQTFFDLRIHRTSLPSVIVFAFHNCVLN